MDCRDIRDLLDLAFRAHDPDWNHLLAPENVRLERQQIGHSQYPRVHRGGMLHLEGSNNRPSVKPQDIDLFDGPKGRQTVTPNSLINFSMSRRRSGSIVMGRLEPQKIKVSKNSFAMSEFNACAARSALF